MQKSLKYCDLIQLSEHREMRSAHALGSLCHHTPSMRTPCRWLKKERSPVECYGESSTLCQVWGTTEYLIGQSESSFPYSCVINNVFIIITECVSNSFLARESVYRVHEFSQLFLAHCTLGQ